MQKEASSQVTKNAKQASVPLTQFDLTTDYHVLNQAQDGIKGRQQRKLKHAKTGRSDVTKHLRHAVAFPMTISGNTRILWQISVVKLNVPS